MPTMTGKTQAEVDQIALTEAKKRRLVEVEAWLNATLAEGFTYGGYTWQADERAVTIALGSLFRNAFPREWRNKANAMILFETAEDFAPFAAEMQRFVDRTFQRVFEAKDNIRAATTLAELEEVQS